MDFTYNICTCLRFLNDVDGTVPKILYDKSLERARFKGKVIGTNFLQQAGGTLNTMDMYTKVHLTHPAPPPNNAGCVVHLYGYEPIKAPETIP